MLKSEWHSGIANRLLERLGFKKSANDDFTGDQIVNGAVEVPHEGKVR